MADEAEAAWSLDDVSGLLEALRHAQPLVRHAAGRALSRLRLDPSAATAVSAALATDERGTAAPPHEADKSAQVAALTAMPRDASRELAVEVLRSTRSPAAGRLAALLAGVDRPDRDALESAARQVGAEVEARGAAALGIGELFALFRLMRSDDASAASTVRRTLEWAASRHGMKQLVRELRPVLLRGRAGDRLAAADLIDGAALAAALPSAPGPDERPARPVAAPDRPQGSPPIYKNAPRPPAATTDERPWPATCELPGPATERRINVWIGDPAAPRYRIDAGTSAVVHFAVGVPVASSLATAADAAVHDGEIPSAGLATRWTVVPRLASLAEVDGGAVIAESGAAVFTLLVPRTGDSASVALRVTSDSENASLTVLIEAGDKRWRELEIALARTGTPASDVVAVPLADVRIAPSHEWTTPPGEVEFTVLMPGWALLTGNVAGQRVNPGNLTDIVTEKALLSGPVDDLRKAVDDFRKAKPCTAYLNDIDPATLRARLAAFQPQYDWSRLDDLADAAHADAWSAASASAELHDLAFYGRRLYDTLFPPGKPSRELLDGLVPGHRVNIVWRPGNAAGWVRIPWDLLYRGDVSPGVPIEATSFWGLRYRVACTGFEPTGAASSRLGAPTEASCTNLLFFGESPKEPATAEAEWQRTLWASLQTVGRPVLVPQSGADTAKQQLVRTLIEPERAVGPDAVPVAVLYLFCHYGADNAGKPILRFGLDSSRADDVVRETELGTSPIASRPLVFANACESAGTGVYEASKLAKSFFDRGCRAYIGSECMVPVAMASRFAMVFFHVLLRETDPDREPISCGEAMVQARLFLWCHYRNIGGLLYSYLNQYDLYLASPGELEALRNG